MKKQLALMAIVTLLLAGCGANPNEDPPLISPEPGGYVFEVDGITIAMHEEAGPILEELGEARGYFEAESCAFDGLDKTYTYHGFELCTYELDGKDYVASIFFLDDSVSTPEGVYLYSSLEDVISAYGDSYSTSFNLYIYELEDSQIRFLIENDHVDSIEYVAVLE